MVAILDAVDVFQVEFFRLSREVVVEDNLRRFPSQLPHEVDDPRPEVRGGVEEEGHLEGGDGVGVQLEGEERRVRTEEDHQAPASHAAGLPLRQSHQPVHHPHHQPLRHLDLPTQQPGQEAQHLDTDLDPQAEVSFNTSVENIFIRTLRSVFSRSR